MSSRERWIVYPLLFFSFILGFWANYKNPLYFRCRTIDCRQLRVGSINGQPVTAFSWPSASQLLSEALEITRQRQQLEAEEGSTGPAAAEEVETQVDETEQPRDAASAEDGTAMPDTPLDQPTGTDARPAPDQPRGP